MPGQQDYAVHLAILAEQVQEYLRELRPPRAGVPAEMEALAERDEIPIVHWETGRFLAVLMRALRPQRVLEVGTAIGYSTVHMAEALEGGQIVTVELDPERAARAREFFAKAGLDDRITLIEGEAREVIAGLDGPFDLVFLDAKKRQTRDYLRLLEPKVREGSTLVVDNMLLSGEVALGDDDPGRWSARTRRFMRELGADLLVSERWLGALVPVGDGLAVATRRTGPVAEAHADADALTRRVAR